jgi:hypothetical protein
MTRLCVSTSPVPPPEAQRHAVLRMLLRGLRGGAPDAGKIPGVLGMQNVLNSVSMAVGCDGKGPLFVLYPVLPLRPE